MKSSTSARCSGASERSFSTHCCGDRRIGANVCSPFHRLSMPDTLQCAVGWGQIRETQPARLFFEVSNGSEVVPVLARMLGRVAFSI